MSKIAYLFGAGASFGTLPLVNEMPVWLNSLIEDLSSNDFLLSDTDSFGGSIRLQQKSKLGYQKELIEGLKWLRDVASRHISIDTYAKKLFVKGDSITLKRLKILLSTYFIIEQIRYTPNPRYDFFFASIVDTIFKFPNDIRILSWNYDYQFEIAYSEFSNNFSIPDNQNILNIFDRNRPIDRSSLGSFGIFKLNGSTEFRSRNFTDQKTYYCLANVYTLLDLKLFEEIVMNYAAFSVSDLISSFSFAWEGTIQVGFSNIIQEETKDTEILIVIGYSFPYFNRSIDKDLLSNMKRLKRVHFQSPEAEQLINRFKSIRNDLRADQLITEKDNRYFFIPDELSK